MQVDLSGIARQLDPEQAREWLVEQRVFVSSAMADTAAERDAVAEAVESEGSRAVRFEELGRGAAADEAYLMEVDSSTIYLAILNELYGTMLPTGFSPTETEYERARERGVRLAVYVARDAADREATWSLPNPTSTATTMTSHHALSRITSLRPPRRSHHHHIARHRPNSNRLPSLVRWNPPGCLAEA